MTTLSFAKLPNGELDDAVRVELAGAETRIFENYNSRISVIQQPAEFSTQLSASKGTADLLRKYPPRTPFVLKIGNYRQFTGETDGYNAQGPAGSTSVTFKGRDLLARLHDSDITAERSFSNIKYGDLVRQAMNANGLQEVPLYASNSTTLTVRAGITPAGVEQARQANEVIVSGPTGVGLKQIVHAKLGESWLNFVLRHIAKAGLFLWTGPDGEFVLARPTKTGQPVFRFVRQRGQLRNVCNVIDAQFKNETTRRVSEVVIYARSRGRKFGRTKIKGGFVDEEMIALGYKRKRVYRDVNVTTAEQAEFYARKKIAELNRASWNLRYTFAGHAAPTMLGGMSILTPDTLARVDDDEYGIHEDLYLETVEYRSPPRTTVVTLMRPRDLVFGGDD